MTAYRFCRSDDIPLLVEAYNRCFLPSAPEAPEMSVAGFKDLIRELNLWTSSCMVASSGDDPIGVLLAAKREDENWIYRIAVHPEHQRQGHGQHLLTSLSQKMAILGPPRLLAEVPQALPSACSFFEACGYRTETVYADFVAEAVVPTSSEAPPIVTEISFSEAVEHGGLGPVGGAPWQRSFETLRNLDQELSGFGAVSDVRIEALILFRETDSAREVLALSCRKAELAEPMFRLLLTHTRRTSNLPLLLPKIRPEEIGFEALCRWGFEPGKTTVGYAAQAQPG